PRFFFSTRRRPPSPSLFPYTTLFRSRTMLVCRVQHAKPQNGVATEWFGHGQTVAMLPLRGDQSSFVLTLSAHAMQSVMALSDVEDRKSTRLNSSHVKISYAVFCLKKK